MAKPPVPVKYKVSNFEWFASFFVSTPMWLVEVLLSLTGIGEIISEILGFFQDGILGYLNWRAGDISYQKNRKNMTFLGSMLIDIVPFINDLPCAPVEILYLRHLSRKNDEQLAVARTVKAKQDMEAEMQANELLNDFLVRRRMQLEAEKNSNARILEDA